MSALDQKLLDVIAEYPRLRAGLVHLGHPMVIDETLHRLQSAGLVDQDPVTRLWSRTATTDVADRDVKVGNSEPAPVETTTATASRFRPTDKQLAWARSLPSPTATLVDQLVPEVRILTLDDVAEPLPGAPRLKEDPACRRDLRAAFARLREASGGIWDDVDIDAYVDELRGRDPVPPRGHPAHGVGPGWGDRVATLEGAVEHLETRLAEVETERVTQAVLLAAELSIREAINRSQAAVMDHVRELFDRIRVVEGDVDALKHPEPVGPVAEPLGIHVEALREREAVAAFIRRVGDVDPILEALANDIERGIHRKGA